MILNAHERAPGRLLWPFCRVCVRSCAAAPYAQPSRAGGGWHPVPVPHALAINQAGLFLALLALGCWHQLRQTKPPQKRGTLLRPRWKKVNPRDEHDRYDDEGGASA